MMNGKRDHASIGADAVCRARGEASGWTTAWRMADMERPDAV
jgi:hypothetical protein